MQNAQGSQLSGKHWDQRSEEKARIRLEDKGQGVTAPLPKRKRT